MLATYFFHAAFLFKKFNPKVDKPSTVYTFLVTYFIVYVLYIFLSKISEYREKINYCIISTQKKVNL